MSWCKIRLFLYDGFVLHSLVGQDLNLILVRCLVDIVDEFLKVLLDGIIVITLAPESYGFTSHGNDLIVLWILGEWIRRWTSILVHDDGKALK